MSYKIGDTVRLKSGGPAMTVGYITDQNKCECHWFNRHEGNFEPKFQSFRPEMLEPVNNS